MQVTKGNAKRVETKDLNGNPNGYLMELNKNGRRTGSYLSVAYPGCFKGYHLHKVREANYVCVRGKLKIILFLPTVGKREFSLGPGDKLHIPMNVPTGLSNEGDEEAWIINFPNPAYDPELKGEQVDFTEEEALQWTKTRSETSSLT